MKMTDVQNLLPRRKIPNEYWGLVLVNEQENTGRWWFPKF